MSDSKYVKDSSHANKYLRKIKINLQTKVEISISTFSNADIATWWTVLNERNSVRQIVDRTHTHLFNGPLFRDYPGEPVPER